ncbi:MAG TPA: metal ABC transporter permease [Vicinamibacterales bacterium]
MNFDTLFDPLFLLPLVNGALVAILLPALGVYTRLREEWLASLGVAQTAAAGVAIGSLVSRAVTVGALAGAAVAGLLKRMAGRSGNDMYAVLILIGWSAALLAAANSTRGEDLARALIEGQLYFTSRWHLVALVFACGATGVVLPWLSPRLLLGRFFPSHFLANGVTHPRHELVFDVLLAACLALAAMTVGVMAAFGLVFVPAWVAFRFAGSWRSTFVLSSSLGLVSYSVSYAAALVLDQPYGFVLVAVLLFLAAARVLPVRA